MARIFVTGGTGFIGAAIVRALRERGDDVTVVSRDGARAKAALPDGVEVVEADPTAAGAWQQRIAGCRAVINLAGASIAGKRWNAQYRQILLDSRVDVTRFVVEGMQAAPPDQRPAVLASASGIDYYPFVLPIPGEDDMEGDAVDLFDEQSPLGDGFLARMCRDWEDEAMRATPLGVRVALVRTGIVLGKGGGALPKMALPFKLMAGGRVADGRQWFSWIHLDDIVGIYLRAIDDDALSGPLNAVAPGAVRQAAFAKALGAALHRPTWMPVPKFALRFATGQLAEYLIHGRHVIPKALQDAGFEFAYPDVEGALAEIYG